MTEQRVQERNWAGNLSYQAERIAHPLTVEELQELVAGAWSIRALGSRHSFNDIADTSGTLTALDLLDPAIIDDAQNMTVTVSGGTRYGTLAAELQRQGFALHNLASLPHISVAGAVATATHGSGDGNGNLATAVAGLELVTADGGILTARRGETADFDGMVVGLGALGIVSSVTLDIKPAFQVAQNVFDPLPGASGSNCTEQLGVPGPWSDRLAHFRMEFTPSKGDELQSEYLVPREHAVDAIRTLLRLSGVLTPLLLVSEIRTIAADRLWLSPNYGRDGIGLHFTWRQDQPAVEAVLPLLEAELAPFAARPRWGKLFDGGAAAVGPLYPRVDDFRALAGRLDPAGKFRNRFLDYAVFGS